MGARNLKTVRVVANFNDDLDARLGRVCDRLGQNKGTMLSLTSALGLSMIEQIIFASENVVELLKSAAGGSDLPFDMDVLVELNEAIKK